ncbi:hypothetical protein JI435_418360, partial [Parastagonospora nodorum SN15]
KFARRNDTQDGVSMARETTFSAQGSKTRRDSGWDGAECIHINGLLRLLNRCFFIPSVILFRLLYTFIRFGSVLPYLHPYTLSLR